MDSRAIYAALVVLAILLIGAILLVARDPARGGARRDGYLVYPYLDLDEPGERGVHYALE
jgi:hypothetical protein